MTFLLFSSSSREGSSLSLNMNYNKNPSKKSKFKYKKKKREKIEGNPDKKKVPEAERETFLHPFGSTKKTQEELVQVGCTEQEQMVEDEEGSRK